MSKFTQGRFVMTRVVRDRVAIVVVFRTGTQNAYNGLLFYVCMRLVKVKLCTSLVNQAVPHVHVAARGAGEGNF